VRWSPRGDKLAVALAPTPLVDDRYMEQTVHVIAVDDGAMLASVSHRGKLGSIAWSPDGAHLAFSGAVDVHDPSPSSLFVASTTGGTPTNLVPGLAGTVSDFVWLDPSTLFMLADEGVEAEVYRIGRDGSGRTALGWRGNGPVLTSISASPATSTLSLLGSTPSHPAEVFTASTTGSEPRRLTDSNPWLAEVFLGRQEVVRWKARDGLELEGQLIHPVQRSEDETVPLVVLVHGGPEGHRANSWLSTYSRPGQVLAARGFAVFYPNYRGSTGRGVEFSKLGQEDAAGAEFDDVVDGVDHLIASGLVDPERVGVSGGSYGGYATAWLSTVYTDRFAAGVMFVGISNKISKTGTTDIPNEENLVHARIWPWQAWQHFLERSPIFHVEKGRTPLLILHGEDDPRVSSTQSKEMFRALKTLGKTPVRLVLYPGEGHGNRRTASRYDCCLRLVRWMEHYLAGPGGDPPDHRLDYRSAIDGWEDPTGFPDGSPSGS